jgi:hypothetical protein
VYMATVCILGLADGLVAISNESLEESILRYAGTYNRFHYHLHPKELVS